MAQVMNTCSEVMPKRGQASPTEEPGYYDDISDTDELEAEDINRALIDTMPASKTTESALVSQVMKEVFGVTSDQMSSLAMVSSQQNENIAAGSTESTTPVAEEEQEEEEEMEGMSRLLTDEEIRKIIGGASGNPTPAPLLEEENNGFDEFEGQEDEFLEGETVEHDDFDEFEEPASPPRCDSPVPIVTPDMTLEDGELVCRSAPPTPENLKSDVPVIKDVHTINRDVFPAIIKDVQSINRDVITTDTINKSVVCDKAAPAATKPQGDLSATRTLPRSSNQADSAQAKQTGAPTSSQVVPLAEADESLAMQKAMGFSGFLPRQNPTTVTNKKTSDGFNLPISPSSSTSSTTSSSRPRNTVWAKVLRPSESSGLRVYRPTCLDDEAALQSASVGWPVGQHCDRTDPQDKHRKSDGGHEVRYINSSSSSANKRPVRRSRERARGDRRSDSRERRSRSKSLPYNKYRKERSRSRSSRRSSRRSEPKTSERSSSPKSLPYNKYCTTAAKTSKVKSPSPKGKDRPSSPKTKDPKDTSVSTRRKDSRDRLSSSKRKDYSSPKRRDRKDRSLSHKRSRSPQRSNGRRRRSRSSVLSTSSSSSSSTSSSSSSSASSRSRSRSSSPRRRRDRSVSKGRRSASNIRSRSVNRKKDSPASSRKRGDMSPSKKRGRSGRRDRSASKTRDRSPLKKRSRSRSISIIEETTRTVQTVKGRSYRSLKTDKKQDTHAEVRKFFVDKGVCFSCGEPDHGKQEDCWVKNKTIAPPKGVHHSLPCAYCRSNLHVVTVCTHLHSKCQDCGKGGHVATDCSDKTTEEWLVKYIRHAANGLGTGMDKAAPFGGRFGFGNCRVSSRQFSTTTIRLVKEFHKQLKRMFGYNVNPLPKDFGVTGTDNKEAEKLQADQVFVLQNFFNRNRRDPEDDDIRHLAKALYLERSTVAEWFKNNRRTSK